MLGLLAGHWWAFMLLGILAGIISGMLGLGSGAVVVPALVLLFAFPQKSAQGTALALMVPMALLGAFRYWKNPQIDVSLAIVGLIALGALPGVLAGTELAARLPSYWLRKVFAVFLAIVAVKMFTASLGGAPKVPGESLVNQNNSSVVEPGGKNNESTEQ
ncbi:MAG: sulfite exporter TauE/SafE family protein [Phycisphaerales bacterium]|nr:MAG: sulfite exporter TauE/SafE family protein [Phycisphaerales bacterium]